jgi:cytochrome c biogenesis protein CcdA
MKILGFLLLFSGWMIVLAAVTLLVSTSERTVFVLAGVGVEVLGLILAIRAHKLLPEGGE